MKIKLCGTLFLVALLSACGGDGGSSAEPCNGRMVDDVCQAEADKIVVTNTNKCTLATGAVIEVRNSNECSVQGGTSEPEPTPGS